VLSVLACCYPVHQSLIKFPHWINFQSLPLVRFQVFNQLILLLFIDSPWWYSTARWWIPLLFGFWRHFRWSFLILLTIWVFKHVLFHQAIFRFEAFEYLALGDLILPLSTLVFIKASFNFTASLEASLIQKSRLVSGVKIRLVNRWNDFDHLELVIINILIYICFWFDINYLIINQLSRFILL